MLHKNDHPQLQIKIRRSHFYKIIMNRIVGFGFCDIQNNQGRGKAGYQPKA